MTKKHFYYAVSLIRTYPIDQQECLVDFMCELGRWANSSFSESRFRGEYERLEEVDDVKAELKALPIDIKDMLRSNDNKTRRLGLIVVKGKYPDLYKRAKDNNIKV